jgi:hypothetical protein
LSAHKALFVLGHHRAASHYGRPSREVVGLNGQSLLRVQKNGLKIANKMWELELLAGYSVKPSKTKPKIQRKKEHPLPKTISPSNGQDLVYLFFLFFMKKN